MKSISVESGMGGGGGTPACIMACEPSTGDMMIELQNFLQIQTYMQCMKNPSLMGKVMTLKMKVKVIHNE